MSNLLRTENGSLWRKWDLHIHAPGTKMNNGYESANVENALARFCTILHESDVEAIGITDYFSLESYFDVVEKYEQMFGLDHGKLFIPNLELRLDHAVHKSGQEVNLHVLLKPDLTRDAADAFLRNLKLSNTAPKSSRHLNCAEIGGWDSQQLAAASTPLSNCVAAVCETFDAATEGELENAAILVASGRNDGLSPGREMSPRKAVLIDSIDKKIHAVFSRSRDAEYWLSTDRFENKDEKSKPKPTLGGCDAHSFDELEKALGKSGSDRSRTWETTWIKAELTWDGLLQTLVEPASRVRIGERKPEDKPAFRVIEQVRFNDGDNFPEKVSFNPHLNSVIGSRSSGKSSLLAHIAFAVDPDETRAQQTAAGVPLGPAAGHSWEDVAPNFCEVVWGGGDHKGKVVYIPQNFLSRLGSDPGRVTDYILPAIRRIDPSRAQTIAEGASRSVQFGKQIEAKVDEWFDLAESASIAKGELSSVGSGEAIREQVETLNQQISKMREGAGLADLDAEAFRAAQARIAALTNSIVELDAAVEWAENMLESRDNPADESPTSDAVQIALEFQWPVATPPQSVEVQIESLKRRVEEFAQQEFLALFQDIATNKRSRRDEEADALKVEEGQNAELFRAFESNESLSELEGERAHYAELADKRERIQHRIDDISESARRTVGEIDHLIKQRRDMQDAIARDFNLSDEKFGDLQFAIEVEFSPSDLTGIVLRFDRKSKHVLFGSTEEGEVCFLVEDAHKDPRAFLQAISGNELKVRKSENLRTVAKTVLSLDREVRFTSTLDGDSIGGFSPSTMTPGKQCLFALSLILSDAGDEWPLLIDQPEDDLDSRSIFNEIVKFLKVQKSRRQIIMVTHNANLVVGSDSDCVIVANRHGSDRPNRAERTFEYFGGPLEHSQPKNDSKTVDSELDKQGVREHVVEILDGGAEAFRKRRERYRI